MNPRLAAIAARRARSHESFQTAAECIGTIAPGCSLFALTRGQFSMVDAIVACLDQVGPSRLSVWTWTVAEYEVQCVERLLRDGRVLEATLIIDYGARDRNAGLLRQWRAVHGPSSVRYVVNHAKIATIASVSGLRLLLRGSFNLNFNPRFEQFDLTEGGADFDLVQSVEAGLPVLADGASGAEIYEASGLAQAFAFDTLKAFEGVKPWAK